MQKGLDFALLALAGYADLVYRPALAQIALPVSFFVYLLERSPLIASQSPGYCSRDAQIYLASLLGMYMSQISSCVWRTMSYDR